MGLSEIMATVRDLLPVGNAQARVLDSTELAIGQRRVPEDIRELLWFSDGPLCNYSQKATSESVSSFDGIRLTVSFFGASEPSAISVKAPVASPATGQNVEPLGYYPSYEGMSPRQRWGYLNWLMDIDQPVDIGYVFVFYYGLERQLFGKYSDQAVDMILRLRAHHAHSSFTRYSSDALLAASLLASRPDWLLKFAETIDSASDVALSDIYLYAKYRHGFDLSPAEMMALPNRVGYTNRRYIKNEPELFESTLQRLLQTEYGTEGVDLSKFDLTNCPLSKHALFANYSLDRDQNLLAVPALTDHAAFRNAVGSLLVATHEDVKRQLKANRAAARSTDSGKS